MTEIRSYRRVFDLERRIYSVDRLRLNPGGVPVRAVAYFVVILLAGLTGSALPSLGTLIRLLPWYLRDLALPCAGATVLSAIRVEGRVFHLAAHALLRYRTGPRRLRGTERCETVGQLWRPQQIVLLPDGSDSRMRRMRYTGPGAVLVSVAHERSGRVREHGSSGRARRGLRPALSLRENAPSRALEDGQVIVLERGVHLRVRPSADLGG